MCFVARKLWKRRWKKQNGEIVETDMDTWYYTYKKQSLLSEQNSAI